MLEPDNIIRGIEGLDFFDNVEDGRWALVKSQIELAFCVQNAEGGH